MTDIDALIAFLRARLDEIESANSGTFELWHSQYCNMHNSWTIPCDCGVPALMAADVAAKRRIIEHVTGSIEALDASDSDQRVSITDLTHVLRLLALPDAGHPDYRAEWRP